MVGNAAVLIKVTCLLEKITGGFRRRGNRFADLLYGRQKLRQFLFCHRAILNLEYGIQHNANIRRLDENVNVCNCLVVSCLPVI